MDNKSFDDQLPATTTTDDDDDDQEVSDATLPISEEERLRQIEKYREMIKNLEASSSSSATDMVASSSRSPLNGAASTSSLCNTLSEESPPGRRGRGEKSFREVVLLNAFKVGRKLHHVYLNEGKLTWEKERRGDSLKEMAIPDSKAAASFHRQIVPLEDIICVRVPAKESSTTFQLHYARRRTRNPNMWKNVSIKFHNSDPRIVDRWVTALQELLAAQVHRPRHILMFVNPYGGRRLAMDIYNKQAQPLFQLAGVDVSLVVTPRQNQVTDIVMNNFLDQYDGIVACGGDGTFNELYNGLVRREILQGGSEKKLMDLELPRPRIPIGVIPGGSTNTISYCLNGTDDVRTSVLNIVLGKTGGLDLSSVHRNDGGSRELLRLYASVMSYGFLGDVSKEAEHYRSLGPKRYDYVGVKKFFKNSGYEAELRILQDSADQVGEGEKCLENCARCGSAAESGSGHGLREELRDLESGGAEEEGNSRWKVVKGKFFMISGANISCACDRSPNGMSPNCHLGDGCLDLILVSHSSLLNNLRLASRLSANGEPISSLPFIKTFRTRAFVFSLPGPSDRGGGGGPTTEEPSINASTVPITTNRDSASAAGSSPKKSSWNCDGEVIEETELIVRSHCQLVRVFRSGIRNRDSRKDCCGLC